MLLVNKPLAAVAAGVHSWAVLPTNNKYINKIHLLSITTIEGGTNFSRNEDVEMGKREDQVGSHQK